MKITYTTLVLIGLIVAGCQSTSPSSTSLSNNDPGELPKNYKDIVKGHIKKSFFDPYSIRDAAIGYPFMGSLPYQSLAGRGWIICYEANAKNRMGGYVGMKRSAVLIKNGEVVANETEDFVIKDLCKEEQKLTPWNISF